MDTEKQFITVVFRATIIGNSEFFIARDGWELRRGKTPEVWYSIFDLGNIISGSLNVCIEDWLLNEKNELVWLNNRDCSMELDVGVFLGEDAPMNSIFISPLLLGILSENKIKLILSSYLCTD
jgi:hypothetical protein